MRFPKTILLTSAVFLFFAFCTVPSHAQGPARHPEYLRALSDLRVMRGYLDKLAPNERIDSESQHAIGEIDAAIQEIKAASIDDGKDIHDHPPIDVHIRPVDRYNKAHEAGKAALNDINRSEDNTFAQGLKHRAWEHIERANEYVEHIIQGVGK